MKEDINFTENVNKYTLLFKNADFENIWCLQ